VRLAGLALVQCEPVSVGVRDETGLAGGEVHDFGNGDRLCDDFFAHRLDVVDFKGGGKLGAGRQADRFGIAHDSEGAAADIELDPRITECFGRNQADDIALKGDRFPVPATLSRPPNPWNAAAIGAGVGRARKRAVRVGSRAVKTFRE